jgi:hypothetical protein
VTQAFVWIDEVTPFSLGVGIDDGLYTPMIERGTPIPAEASRLFTTVADGQSAVEINVMQGGNGAASVAPPLVRFLLSGIPAARRGEPRIVVHFRLDAEGILHASARARGSKARQSVSLALACGAGAPSGAPSRLALTHRKNRVLSLSGKLSRATALRTDALNVSLRAEIGETVWKAGRCLHSGSPADLDECVLAMETLLGELSAMSGGWKEGRGGA